MSDISRIVIRNEDKMSRTLPLRDMNVFRLEIFIALLLFAAVAQAQTFQVLHSFSGGDDGANPEDGLTMDASGNLYGTASAGGIRQSGCSNFWGSYGCGNVFELKAYGSSWVAKPLYEFKGGSDYGNPGRGVVFGPDGALYGVTGYDVFRLAPPPTFCPTWACSWQETVLHQFSGSGDGSGPSSRLVFNSAGNIFGVTYFGGPYNNGTIYELSHNGGGWTESIIYAFNSQGGLGQGLPEGNIVFDPAGNLYGTTDCSATLGCFWGAVWQLQPSQSGWNLTNLYQWPSASGYQPVGVIRDSAGNLYGSDFGDSGIPGAIYELSPSNGGWNYTQLYDFQLGDLANGLVMDAAGNLYGADYEYGYGYIFKMTPSSNGWTFTTLHTFSGPDGEFPQGQIVIDRNGNLYGTTIKGGSDGYGVVWEITP
jgi:hypothetical protein